MDLLTELIFVLSQHRVGLPESLLPKNSKLKKLYQLVAMGKVTSDEEAAQLIYKSAPKDKRYLMLKRNLIGRLADLMLEAEPNESYRNNYSHIQFLFEQKLAVTEKLLQQNVYHNAEKIIGKVERKAESYHLVAVQLRCARQLRTIHALKGFPGETEAYDRAVGILSKHFICESKAQGFSQIIQSKSKFFISYNPELVSQAKDFNRTISDWLEEFPSPFLQLYAHRIRLVLYRQTRQETLWKESLTALAQLPDSYPFLKSNALELEIALEKVRFYRAVADLTSMKESLDKCLELSDYQAFNKFEVMALAYDLAMKQLDWETASEIIREVFSVPQFPILDPIDHSAWHIRALYLNYICLKTQRCEIAFPPLSQRQQVYQFLTNRQPVSKDKKGYNLHLVLLRLLFQKYYAQQDTSADGNKMLVYFQRHLKLLEHERTGIFFKSLARVASYGFDAAYVGKRSTYFYQKLMELDKGGVQYDACEIIPYEQLWEIIFREVS